MAYDNKRRYVVTGGAGMIGSGIVWALNNRGIDNILIVDCLGKDEKWRNLVPLQYSDYLDAREFLQITKTKGDTLGPISTVFHMGACSSTTETNAKYLMRNNFAYTRDIAQWAVSRRFRFIYASSAATYGDGSEGMSDQTEALYAYRPLNMYGYSKHLFDCHAIQRGISRGITGLKFFNVFGPNEHHKDEMRSLVCKGYHEILQTGKMRLFRSHHPDYSDGEQKRDFLYLKDAVEMTLHLAEIPLAGGLFNLGSGQATTWLELAEAIFAAMGRPSQIEFIEMPEHLRDTYQYFTQAEMTRFQGTNYTEPMTSLEEAVRDYIQKYLIPGHYLGDEPWEEDEDEAPQRS